MDYKVLSSISSMQNIDDYSQLSKLSGSSKSDNFESIFSSMVNGGVLQESFDLTSLIFLLYLKLFGEDFVEENTKTSQNSPKGNPVNGVVTQNSHDGHTAIDFGVPIGTRVRSTMAGKVAYAGWNTEGYGNLVIVENGPYKTYYAHLSSVPVSIGQGIKEGEVIGFSGNTGNSTGPHLHYEIRKNGVQIDPTLFLGN